MTSTPLRIRQSVTTLVTRRTVRAAGAVRQLAAGLFPHRSHNRTSAWHDRRMDSKPTDDSWLTPDEVAKVLKLTPTEVTTALRAGELPGIRVQGHWRIRRASLDAFLDGQPAPTERETTLAMAEQTILNLIEQQRLRKERALKTLGPMPLPPAESAGKDERVRYFFQALWWGDQHDRLTLTPREQAEAAWTPTSPYTVDELEDRIRADRDLPPLDRETGMERWDLLPRTQAELDEDEAWARDWAERSHGDNPKGLPFDEYLEVWRSIVGLTPRPQRTLQETLEYIRELQRQEVEEVMDD